MHPKIQARRLTHSPGTVSHTIYVPVIENRKTHPIRGAPNICKDEAQSTGFSKNP